LVQVYKYFLLKKEVITNAFYVTMRYFTYNSIGN